MTDPYNSDPQNQDEHKEETGAEVWHDDRPPVDDFADHPAEEAVASEEAMPEGDQSEAPVTEKKKRSILLPIAVGIIGVLFLGAMLYIQFGGSNSNTNPPPIAVASSAPSSPTTAAASTTSSTPASGDVDIGSLYNGATQDQSQGKPTAADAAPTTSSAIMTPPPAPASTPASPPSVVPSKADQPTQPSLQPSPPPMAVQNPIVMPAPIAPAPPTSATSDNGAAEQRLSALTSRVDDLQKALDQATQQLGQVSNMVAANPPSQNTAQTNPALEERLDKLEQRLAQLSNSETASTSSGISEPQPTSRSNSVVMSRMTHKAKHKSRKHGAPKNVAHNVSRHHTKVANAGPANTHWVLRAATPDSAWVATSASSADLRRVEIGDDLPGVGRVRAIHQTGDSWVIEGSKGTVH